MNCNTLNIIEKDRQILTITLKYIILFKLIKFKKLRIYFITTQYIVSENKHNWFLCQMKLCS